MSAVDIELVTLYCKTCGGVFAVETQYIYDAPDDQLCYYCGSVELGTVVCNERIN